MKRSYVPLALTLLASAMVCTDAAVGAENVLGSPAEAPEVAKAKAAAVGKPAPDDYRGVVEASFPRYKNADLKKRFSDIKQKYPRGRDNIKLWSLDAIERTFGLSRQKRESQDTRVETENRAYSADRAKGRVFLYDAEGQPEFMTETEGRRALAQVAKQHERVLEQAGITKDEILFKKTSMMLMQAMTSPEKGAPKETEPLVRSIQTYALRAVDGIMVEGSAAKIGSRAPGKVEMLDIKWPPFEYPPQVRSFELRKNDVIKSRVTERVKQVARGRQANVKMAVVLRPVSVEGKQYYVPSLKVGIQAGAEGDEGEGALIYEDLLQEQVQYDDADMEDEGAGGEQEEPEEQS